MGDRGTVYVHDGDDDGVYLYSHNYGSDLPDIVRAALEREQRWDDDAYLARIIFCQMVKGDVDGETGYGISASPTGGSTTVDVDVSTQRVSVDGAAPQSFRDFIAASD